MPIYEYQCQSCGKTLEALQKVSDAPLIDCPHCAKPDLKKQISLTSFQLKGSGWYVTDFKDKPKQTSSAPSETKKESTKTEATASEG